MSTAAKPVAIEELKDSHAMMDDGARVTWREGFMVCTCVQAKRCRNVKHQMCKHILQCMRDKVDYLGSHAGATVSGEVIELCILLPMAAGNAESMFIQCVLGVADETGLREVRVPSLPTVGSHVLCYVPAKTCRLDLREMVWPFIVQIAREYRCNGCGIPSEMEGVHFNNPSVPEQTKAVRYLLHLLDSRIGKCPNCDNSDIIPDLDTPF
jgi:hypothetical protein